MHAKQLLLLLRSDPVFLKGLWSDFAGDTTDGCNKRGTFQNKKLAGSRLDSTSLSTHLKADNLPCFVDSIVSLICCLPKPGCFFSFPHSAMTMHASCLIFLQMWWWCKKVKWRYTQNIIESIWNCCWHAVTPAWYLRYVPWKKLIPKYVTQDLSSKKRFSCTLYSKNHIVSFFVLFLSFFHADVHHPILNHLRQTNITH